MTHPVPLVNKRFQIQTYMGIEGIYLDDSLRLTFDRLFDFDCVSDISSESSFEQERDTLADIKRRLSSNRISRKVSDDESSRVSSKKPAFDLESRIGNPMHVSTSITTVKKLSFLDELKARQSKIYTYVRILSFILRSIFYIIYNTLNVLYNKLISIIKYKICNIY
jgi:hypothetical protein